MGNRTYWIFRDVFGQDFLSKEGLVYYHREAGFFHNRETRMIRPLFAYEQDGVFYEFFSGERLGVPQEEKHPYLQCKRRILPIEKTYKTLRFYRQSFGDESSGGAGQYSQVEFAEHLKPYMPDRELIADAIRKYIANERQHYIKSKEQEKREQAERARRNDLSAKSAKTSWVDDMIDNQRK